MVDIRLCPQWFVVPSRERTLLRLKLFDAAFLPSGNAQPPVFGPTGRSKRSYHLF
ncbi:hypothetical protein [Chthonomonas calidirosea]|uniref:hypothetical protein n=1 Tax=Chthonomonas calidirosea TaxID=454171 RepID=UPI000A4D9855|nr:hypothetical protein [Chthonomonas calidirosea]